MLKPSVGNEEQQPAALHLVEEINHRVINEYTDVICTLCVAAMETKNPETRKQLTLAANRLNAFAQAHRSLVPPESRALVDLGDYICRICERMLDASLGDRGAQIALETDDALVSACRCWRIGLVVAELIRNACKHGFSGGSGNILIDVAQADGKVVCTVRDDGCANIADRRGRGRRLIELIAAEMAGSIHWNFTRRGSIATVCVPALDLL